MFQERCRQVFFFSLPIYNLSIF